VVFSLDFSDKTTIPGVSVNQQAERFAAERARSVAECATVWLLAVEILNLKRDGLAARLTRRGSLQRQ
jgi:hypothetical protein